MLNKFNTQIPNSMKPAIDVMKSEHRLIESVLDALDSYVRLVSRGEKAAQEDLPRFIRFVEEFADTKHHAKEEDILFVAMMENGFPNKGGPLACMLREHEAGRVQMEILKECAGEPLWSDETIATIITACVEFSSTLRAHIFKEDHMIYEMALTQLPTETMSEVDRACQKQDEESETSGASKELRTLAASLISRYGCAKRASQWAPKPAEC